MEDTKIETLEDTDAEHMGPKLECSEASFMNLNTGVENFKCAKMITGTNIFLHEQKLYFLFWLHNMYIQITFYTPIVT